MDVTLEKPNNIIPGADNKDLGIQTSISKIEVNNKKTNTINTCDRRSVGIKSCY